MTGILPEKVQEKDIPRQQTETRKVEEKKAQKEGGCSGGRGSSQGCEDKYQQVG